MALRVDLLLALLLSVVVWSLGYEDTCRSCRCSSGIGGCVVADCSSSNLTDLKDVPNATCILILRNNSIQSLHGHELQRLGNLTELDLSENLIENITDVAFKGLSKLQKLNLSSNQIQFVQDGDFQGLDNLSQLDLAHNKMTRISENLIEYIGNVAFRGLSMLLTLNLSDNKLRFVQDGDFQGLNNLSLLDLSFNEIGRISEHGFGELRKLITMNLANNSLDFDVTRVPSLVFKSLVNLRNLQLNGNSYDKYPDEQLKTLKSLQNLTLDGLSNKNFGSGFLSLGNLTSVTLDCANRGVHVLHGLTFLNVPSIKTLNISRCNISLIEPETFSPLHDIDTLDLSYNEHLTFYGVKNATCGLQRSNLKRLFVNRIVPRDAVCIFINKTIVECLHNISLVLLEANENLIEKIDMEALRLLPQSLKSISVGNARFRFGEVFYHLDILSALEYLDLSGKRVWFEPFSDTEHPLPHVKHYQHRSLSGINRNKMERNPNHLSHRRRAHEITPLLLGNANMVKIPPNLTTFKFSFAELYYHLSNIHLNKNQVNDIDLSLNVFSQWHGPFTGVEHVKYLNLSWNFGNNVNLSFFEHFTSLEYLDVSNNHLGDSLCLDEQGKLFHKQKRLIFLSLSSNNIEHIPYQLIQGCSSLQTLDVSNNEIYNLCLNLSHVMKTLKCINSSHNHIEYISTSFRQTLDRIADNTNLSLDLSFNRIRCTCEYKHLDFLDWLNTTKVNLLNKDDMRCAVDDDTWVPLWPRYIELKDTCRSYTALMIGLFAVLVITTNVIVSGILYRYRWRLIYFYYVGKRKLKFKRHESDTQYSFDAFVSYCDDDLEFVTPLMISRLEHDQGLSLYIRDRDSLPGESIAENIIDGITRSRKSILLISEASLTKKWWGYEFQMANMEEISTKRDAIIFVMLEYVPTNSIPSECLYKMQEKSPLQYPCDEVADTNMFWASLVEEIGS